ncbi:MAG TPA: Uma2 family endonuclease [Hyphomonadaceae bacterium]|jgi:Uma2 family endonuclease|nr:Uma2 family endonuclease [Hyphomonadaceae bacterium]
MDGSQSAKPADIRRRRFTAADVQAMLDAGILRDGEKVELIGGELVEMSPQGPLHNNLSAKISYWVIRNLPEHLMAAAQGVFRLGEHDEPEPELLVYPASMDINDVRGSDATLVAEVSHSSLAYDLGYKANLYAAHGVREYWVVDVENRRTLVHRLGADGLYGEPAVVLFSAPLSAPGGASLVIADLAPKA